ncbi:class II fructose-1 [Spiroplasma sp. TIUS-1]|uniref:ECF transporter S component n=1 Tax=Spiroplasma sp. TIUS-1 TaxID=216963 RepID=UPI00139711DE|nr:ECF transporter S component [Spiroplasma sp. TIUS-1]QHX35768.1 class II fructose-1 [Spiroplasma sp. TIUS-1]
MKPRIFTTRNIAYTGLLTALMYVIGLITIFIGTATGSSIIQFSDVILFSLFGILANPVLIVSSIVSSILLDATSGMFIYIPITALIKILIIITLIITYKLTKIKPLSIVVAYLWVFLYVLFAYLLFDESYAIREAIIDTIQYGVTVIFASIFISLYDFKKIKILKEN